MKSDLKEKAVHLRKKNESYNSISNKLGISKSTLSLWFRDENWSLLIKKRLTSKNSFKNDERLKKMNNRRRINLEVLYKNMEDEAVKEFSRFKNNPLFLSALSIYWGEGDKVFKNGQVRVSNIDWKMLNVFRKFLEEICFVPINKVHGAILLYPDLKTEECLNFWSSHVNLPKQNFFKPVVIKGRAGIGRSTPYGIGIVQVCNKALKKKILKWIELISDKLRD